jgi:hypothetical protein
MKDVDLTSRLIEKLDGIRNVMNVEAIKIQLGYLNPTKRYLSAFVDNRFTKIALEDHLGIPMRDKWQHRDPGMKCQKCGHINPFPEKGDKKEQT